MPFFNRCPSLKLNLSLDIDDNQLYEALRKLNMDAEIELNKKLWTLISDSVAQPQLEVILQSILNGIESYEGFDEKTWVLLHLVYEHCSAIQSCRQFIITTLQTMLADDTRESPAAIEVCLYLLSKMSLAEAQTVGVTKRISASQDSWAWLVLLASLQIDSELTGICDNRGVRNIQDCLIDALHEMGTSWENEEEKQIPLLSVFMKTSHLSNENCTILLNNIVEFRPAMGLIRDPQDALCAILTLSNYVDLLTETVREFLENVQQVLSDEHNISKENIAALIQPGESYRQEKRVAVASTNIVPAEKIETPLLTDMSGFSLDLSSAIDNSKAITHKKLRETLEGMASSFEGFAKQLWTHIIHDSEEPIDLTFLLRIDFSEDFSPAIWVLLHLFHAKKNVNGQQFLGIVRDWLRKKNDDSVNAMQARLFLMSQAGEVLDEALIVKPILACKDQWAWLVLFSHKSFKAENYDKALLKQGVLAVLESDPVEYQYKDRRKSAPFLQVFVKTTGVNPVIQIGLATRIALLNNLASLNDPKELCRAAALANLEVLVDMTLSLHPDSIGESQAILLAFMFVRVLENAQFEFTEAQQKMYDESAEINDPIKRKAAQSELAEKIQGSIRENTNRLSGLIDKLIVLNAILLEKLNSSLFMLNVNRLANGYKQLLDCIPQGFWDSKDNRIKYNTELMNWLLNLDIFANFTFLDWDNAGSFLENIFNINDTEFLSRIFDFTRLSSKNLERAIPLVAKYAIKSGANVDFKNRDEIKQILDLETIFVEAKVAADLEGANAAALQLKHGPTFVTAIQHYYQPHIIQALAVLRSSLSSKEEVHLAYKRVKRIEELLKRLSADDRGKLIDNDALNILALQFRYSRNLRIMNKAETVASSTMLPRKEHKNAFMLVLIEMYSDIVKKSNTEFPAYCAYKRMHGYFEGELPVKGRAMLTSEAAQTKAKEQVDRWLRDYVLYSTPGMGGSETAKTLLRLPDLLLERIFQDTSITVEGIFKAAYPSATWSIETRQAKRVVTEVDLTLSDDGNSEIGSEDNSTRSAAASGTPSKSGFFGAVQAAVLTPLALVVGSK